MQIDLGGIAKGYAMDEALAVLQQHGIRQAMVEAGGDMRLGDPPPGRAGWRVGILPLDDPQGKPLSYLELSRVAVSTSGDMIQYVEIGGKRYSHVVDPRTGMALTDHCRVMVVGPPAWPPTPSPRPSPCSGRSKGSSSSTKSPGMAAMVTRSPSGKIEHYESSRWKELRQVQLGGEPITAPAPPKNKSPEK